MKKYLYYLKKIYSWLLPHTCILCGHHSARSQDLCEKCFLELPSLSQACYRCATPFNEIKNNLLCGGCLKISPPFNFTYALFVYKSPITNLIMNLKFGKSLVNARIFGELITKKIQNEWYRDRALPEVIIPVPLHSKRLQERGFNQAMEIAKPIAKKLNLPLEYKKCKRLVHTAAQATLPAKQREQNVKNAFWVENSFSYKHVAVLDDVITTGFTITEFCKSLRKAGVEVIDVWCCARPEKEKG